MSQTPAQGKSSHLPDPGSTKTRFRAPRALCSRSPCFDPQQLSRQHAGSLGAFPRRQLRAWTWAAGAGSGRQCPRLGWLQLCSTGICKTSRRRERALDSLPAKPSLQEMQARSDRRITESFSLETTSKIIESNRPPNNRFLPLTYLSERVPTSITHTVFPLRHTGTHLSPDVFCYFYNKLG